MATLRDVSQLLDLIGSTEGAILYRGPEHWQILPPGNPGQVLEVGADAIPRWVDP